MAFTDEDRNILIETATKVANVEGWMENLPCQQHPPECTQEHRLESLEKTRGRAISASIKGLVAVILSVGAYCVTKLIGTGG
jgi:hypothetical protein